PSGCGFDTLDVLNASAECLLVGARNYFSDVVPAEISSFKRLLWLDLSDNNLRGPIPREIHNLTRLLTIRLENNVLAGEVPDLSTALPELRELNLSNNKLHGKVPSGLVKKFGLRSVAGNAGLCGMSPLPVCSFTGSPPTAVSAQTVVPSNPSSLPATTAAGPTGKGESRKGLSTGAIVAIVVGNSVAYYCGRNSGESHR
ncbi:PREDICTED: leucine-rich repeat receptor-like protein kinase PXC1, partial [Nelumbo nucifera]|uniref:Leucine-rich repeat receptor-like protein kinase PXC1 n=1 Tax=Nelumbo nucifera TaxID=4432 RepID=A0A1U8Q098_NELNU